MKRGAYFDVDYTILSSNSASLFIKFMRQRGEVGIKDILLSLYYLAQYKLNILDFETIADREMLKVAGQPEEEMIALCNEWFEEMVVEYIYPEAVDLISRHTAEGDVPVLLTAATNYLAEPLAKRLGINHYLCNRLEIVDGKFTGKLKRPLCYGEGKIHWAEEFAKEQGLKLEESYYYSDSITDLPALLRFGHPVAVNPDALLKKEAVKRDWPILRFSKSKKSDL